MFKNNTNNNIIDNINNCTISDIYIRDAIADITVGYNLSREKLQKLGVERLRLYAQIINPAYFTKFNGGDPEYNGSAYQDDFPSLTCNFGLNLSF